MITEKGIKDHAWCPTLWKDTEGNSKRYKEERRSDPTWDLIRQAAETGEPNQRCYVEKGVDSLKITSYDDRGLWLITPGGEETTLLLSIEEIRAQADVLTVRRRQRQSDNEDMRYAEEMTRRVLQMEFELLFPEMDVVVETKYDGMRDIEKTEMLTEEEVDEATRYMDIIRASSEGEMALQANTDRCPMCWWRACPVKQLQEQDKPCATDGNARIEML